MTVNTRPPIEVGDRFVTRDQRDAGRVVEVIEVLPLPPWHPVRGWASARERDLNTRFIVRTEVHPLNPSAVGKETRISQKTLWGSYRKISR